MKKLCFSAVSALSLVVAVSSVAATFTEDFSENPALPRWHATGNTNLFQHNLTNQNLQVTWDSSQANSYFIHPLGTILGKDDDFSLAFDLQLSDITVGTTPDKPYTFQIAVGLLKWGEATGSNFLRGTGVNSPNLVELDYFPDSGFGATLSPVLISSNNEFGYSFYFDEVTTGALYHVEMAYTSSNLTLHTTMTRNDVSLGPVADAVLGTNFSDFRLDSFSISSYSDVGQDPMFAGSVLAHGVIDNVVVTVPLAIDQMVGTFNGEAWETQFISRSNLTYTLERSSDLQTWSDASSAPGNGAALMLQDMNPPALRSFYRVRAERP